MQQTQNVLEKAVLESNNNVYSLSAQIIQLRVVQQATSHLMDKIDEITHKGWHEDIGMAHAAILEIQDTLRLLIWHSFRYTKICQKKSIPLTLTQKNCMIL